MADTNLKQLVFNKLSKAKYEELKQAGQLNANEFYITPDESVTQDDLTSALALKADKSDTYTKAEVDSKIAEKDSLPAQTGNNGKFLSTNGTTASWEDLPTASTETAGIVKMASSTEVTSGTSTTTAVSPKDLKDAKDALTTEINKKADASDLDDYTTTEDLEDLLDAKADKSSVYTKSEIDGKLTGAFHYKGTKPSYTDLPSSGNEQGDVWNVEDTGANYAWTGTEWDKLSETVDLSGYYTKTQVDTELAKKADNSTVSALDSRVEDLEETAEGLDDRFDAKADKDVFETFQSTVASTYETKADATSKKNALDAAIAEKADQDDLDSLESRVEAVESSVATKAEKSYVDTELAKKADASDLGDYLTTEDAEETYATKEELAADKAELSKAIEDRVVAIIRTIED